MSLERFVNEPWKTSYKAYDESPFNIRPAPEFATAEVLVASLYRSLGFAEYPEGEVPRAGRGFDRASQQARAAKRLTAGAGVGADTWRTILHGVLESPKQPNQSSKRFLQLSPTVPDIALYSGSARLSGNPWNPGSLIQRMVQLGSESTAAADDLWNQMFESLSIGEGDDIWARWLQGEFERRKTTGPSWEKRALEAAANIPDVEKPALRFPARQFVRDIEAILAAKSCMTRRQWISLFEAIVRLGSATHVLWLCDLSDKLWRQVRAVLEGEDVPEQKQLNEEVISSTRPYIAYGNPAVPIIRDYASRYLVARLGLNLLLWKLEAMGRPIKTLASCRDLRGLLTAVADQRPALNADGLLAQFASIQDKQARTVACKNGIGSNLVEFGRHTLGQRQTANERLRGYDQGYILRKKGEHASAPWIVSLGPVAVLAVVHCCLREASGPRSVQRLCQHLSLYGIDVDRDDIAKSDLGRKLRMLGLVLDSPDAESGMLLVPPFAVAHSIQGRVDR